MDLPNGITLKRINSSANEESHFFPPDEFEQKISSDKFLTVSHLQEVLFKNSLIKPHSFISAPKSVEIPYKILSYPFRTLPEIISFADVVPHFIPFSSIVSCLTDV